MDGWGRRVLDAAREVHRVLGPGLPDTVYRLALAEELRVRGIPYVRDRVVPIRYRGVALRTGLHLDLVVGEELLVEVHSVERVTDWHRAQLLTHLRLSGVPEGLLINFNVPVLQRGIWRARAP
jgi:GxxExxY protein